MLDQQNFAIADDDARRGEVPDHRKSLLPSVVSQCTVLNLAALRPRADMPLDGVETRSTLRRGRAASRAVPAPWARCRRGHCGAHEDEGCVSSARSGAAAVVEDPCESLLDAARVG